VTSIGTRAFDPRYLQERSANIRPQSGFFERLLLECGNLISVVLPDSLTSIGDGAFEDCYDLETAVIPDGVTSIGKHAFLGCDSLTEIAVTLTVKSTCC
jgi:hypothetical protein